MNEGGKQDGSRERKKWNCSAIATKALANSMENSGAGMALQNHLELRSEVQIFVHHIYPLFDADSLWGWSGTLSETAP